VLEYLKTKKDKMLLTTKKDFKKTGENCACEISTNIYSGNSLSSHSELTTAGHYMCCKPEAANTVRAPDDERYAARNMLSLQ
jgi:hypothetical protein